MKREATRAKRGRPPKFGRPGQVVAMTLPEEAIRGLKQVDADLAWAIVRLLERRSRRPGGQPRVDSDSELLGLARGRVLIVVNRKAFRALPGVNLIPLDRDRAFLALDHGGGVADLELAVLDRMAHKSIPARERAALASLRERLRRWRRDPKLRWQTQSIVVAERVRGRA